MDPLLEVIVDEEQMLIAEPCVKKICILMLNNKT